MRSDRSQAAERSRCRDRSSPEARRYRRPRLDRLGDLRSLTLGTSAGIQDSGIGSGFFNQPI